MRIVFDVYELVPGQGKSMGIYNYAKNLLKAMLAVMDANTELLVLCNGKNQADFSYPNPAVSTIALGSGAPGKIARLGWFFGGAALTIRKLQADVYFSPKGFCPKGLKALSPGIKTAVVIHDLIPLWYAEHFPGHFGRLEELFINSSIVASAKYADKIIAISQTSADDIAARTGRKQRVSVVYNGVSITEPGPRPVAEPYIFAMTSPLPHKNAAGVLAGYQAYRALVTAPLPLYVCGSNATDQAGVTPLKNLSDADLHAYYANAELFVFLSFIEGFGFPPVEALAHGTAVLCSDIPSLREISQGMANYVDVQETTEIGRKIAELLTQENTAELRNQRITILDAYTWPACANGVLNVLTN